MKCTQQHPLVTIAIPTYNGAERLPHAIKHILNQEYPNLEILISDNASDDETQKVVQSYLYDPRIKYFRQDKNLGVVGNFNFLLKHASGQYFMWMCDDDELIPGVIEKYVDYLENHPSYALACGEIDYWDHDQLYHEEKGMSLEGKYGILRAFRYYRKVSQGALIYGMYRTDIAIQSRLPNVLGNDWHYVAAIAYLGKVAQLNFKGYNKFAGGISANFKSYAQTFGEAKIWGHLPYVKIGLDAFAEVLYRNPVYKNLGFFSRFFLGLISFLGINIHYYGMTLPRILGGKLLRYFQIKTPRERRLKLNHKSLLPQNRRLTI